MIESPRITVVSPGISGLCGGLVVWCVTLGGGKLTLPPYLFQCRISFVTLEERQLTLIYKDLSIITAPRVSGNLSPQISFYIVPSAR